MYSHNCVVKFSDIMAVVIDCGTDTTRVGLSRSHGPGVIFPTIVGIPKSVSILRLVEQELLTFPEHQSLPPVLSGIRVIRFLVLCVCCCLFFWPLCCLFFFDIRILIYPVGYEYTCTIYRTLLRNQSGNQKP
jgi:hypothetical protein